MHCSLIVLLAQALACKLATGTTDINLAATFRQAVPERNIGGGLGVGGSDSTEMLSSMSMSAVDRLSGSWFIAEFVCEEAFSDFARDLGETEEEGEEAFLLAAPLAEFLVADVLLGILEEARRRSSSERCELAVC